MESLKCDFEFDFIDPNFENVNHQKTLLWIVHANKIPPHIGISVDGYFFSLKVDNFWYKPQLLFVFCVILLE